MTVKDLKALIATLPDNLLVILQKDAEGNGYSPLSEGERLFYLAESTWSGEVYSEDDEPDEDAVPCLVLIPTN